MVSELLTNKLELPNIELEHAHRVGQLDAHRHRTIVVRFTRYGDREAVMRNVTKLKGTRIYINEDLCPASQNIRKAQIPAMKQAKSEGKVAYFRHTELIIKEQPNSDGSSRRVVTTSASTHGSSDRPDDVSSGGSAVGSDGSVVVVKGRDTLPDEDSTVTDPTMAPAADGSFAVTTGGVTSAADRKKDATTTRDNKTTRRTEVQWTTRSSHGGR